MKTYNDIEYVTRGKVIIAFDDIEEVEIMLTQLAQYIGRTQKDDSDLLCKLYNQVDSLHADWVGVDDKV